MDWYRVQLLTMREFSRAVRSRLLLLVVALPLLSVVLLAPMGLIMSHATTREVVVQHEPELDKTAAVLKGILEHKGSGLETSRPYRVRLVVSSRDEMEQQRVKLAEQIRRNELLAFLEIKHSQSRSAAETKQLASPELFVFSDLQNHEAFGLRERLEASHQLFAFLEFAPDLRQEEKANEAGVFENRAYQSASEAEPAVRQVDMRNIFKLVVVGALSMAIQMLFSICSAPLCYGLTKERDSNMLLTLLQPFQAMELGLGKFLSATLVFSIAISSYGAIIGIPSICFGIVSLASILWFLLFAHVSFFAVAGWSLYAGIICVEREDAGRILFPINALTLIVPLTVLVVIKIPSSSLAQTLGLIPIAGGIVAPARLMTLGSLPLWELLLPLVITSLFSLGICTYAFSNCTVEHLLSSERKGWIRLFLSARPKKLKTPVEAGA